ncbi:1253_t:CDS:2, partial [Funneliformis geosporum]
QIDPNDDSDNLSRKLHKNNNRIPKADKLLTIDTIMAENLFSSNSLQTLTNMNNLFSNNSFINPFQMFASFFQLPQFLQPSQSTNSQIAFSLSQVLTILNFLKNLDIQEGRVDTEEAFIHYLPGFQSQRVSVKHLSNMTDEEFIIYE